MGEQTGLEEVLAKAPEIALSDTHYQNTYPLTIVRPAYDSNPKLNNLVCKEEFTEVSNDFNQILNLLNTALQLNCRFANHLNQPLEPEDIEQLKDPEFLKQLLTSGQTVRFKLPIKLQYNGQTLCADNCAFYEIDKNSIYLHDILITHRSDEDIKNRANLISPDKPYSLWVRLSDIVTPDYQTDKQQKESKKESTLTRLVRGILLGS